MSREPVPKVYSCHECSGRNAPIFILEELSSLQSIWILETRVRHSHFCKYSSERRAFSKSDHRGSVVSKKISRRLPKRVAALITPVCMAITKRRRLITCSEAAVSSNGKPIARTLTIVTSLVMDPLLLSKNMLRTFSFCMSKISEEKSK